MDESRVRTSVVLAVTLHAPRLARRFVADFCDAAGLREEICEAAALLTSVLVTNALECGTSQAELEVELLPRLLRVSIADDSPRPPGVGDTADVWAERRRGALLMSQLAERWGTERLPAGGKAVWFELATAADPARPAALAQARA